MSSGRAVARAPPHEADLAHSEQGKAIGQIVPGLRFWPVDDELEQETKLRRAKQYPWVTDGMWSGAGDWDDPERLADLLLERYGKPRTDEERHFMRDRWLGMCNAGNEGIEMLKKGCG